MKHLGNKPFENTVGKGEIARNEQILLLPQCFLPVWITFCHFCQILNCRLQTLSVWKSEICRLEMGKVYFHRKYCRNIFFYKTAITNFWHTIIHIICSKQGVPRGSVVRCLTRNPGVLGSSLTRSSGFFRGSVLGQDISEPSLVLVKPRKA